MAVFTRRVRIPKKYRVAVAQIINEITAVPQKRGKTYVYHNGVADGVELVRKRALDRGIPLDGVPEPFAVVTELLVDFDQRNQGEKTDE